MKRKMLVTALCLVSVLTACGGSSSSSSAESVATTASETEAVEATSETEPSEEAVVDAISIDEQEIYNQDGVIVTVTGYDDSGFMGPAITMLVENDSETGITVQVRNESINGYMVDMNMSCDVAPGKKANDSLDIFNNSLEECGIDTIADIEFSLHIFETDTFKSIADSDMVLLQTNASGAYVQEYDDSGDVLYDDGGIRIISKGIDTEKSFLGPEICLYIENNSDTSVTVQAKDTSINGFMIDHILSAEVAPGKKAIDGLTFTSSDLEENGIENIETVETSFRILQTDNYSESIETEPIAITF